MKKIPTDIPEVFIIEPDVFRDQRGCFLETWQKQRYEQAGIKDEFVQDNVSYSTKGTLRGLHYQNPNQQGKLVQILSGKVFDVAVDIRPDSPTFKKWVGVILSADNYQQIYIPPGFAHGFCVLSETVIFSYKCTDYYNSQSEGGIIYNDPDIGIDWPGMEMKLSEKDATAPVLRDIAVEKLPKMDIAK
jgi:dTDP-4-dehydrorhamnose 3,5-epimerase